MRAVLAVIAFTLLLRLPFLNLAIQGDDGNYLSAAQYAQIDPAHPSHLRFVFQGDWVSMRGHPHPPLNAWILAVLLALTGDVKEPVYHTVYILFSLAAALAALSIARRYCDQPLLATLLFLATPAFVINGTSLESDLPFLAFWLTAIAFFIRGSPVAFGLMPFAAMTAFQSIVLVPILAVYLWIERRDWKAGWLSLAIIPLTLVSWQLFEKLTSEALPAQALWTYFQQYGLQSLTRKLRNAAGLGVHALWMFQPALAYALIRRRPASPFLLAWIGIFFAAALAIFFAGSARYLLPMALPIAILVTATSTRPLLYATLILQLTISLALAYTNAYQWNAYRSVIARWQPHFEFKRVWINGEWGLRWYAESAGALPMVKAQPVRPGDLVISSRLALPLAFTTGGGALATIEERPIQSPVPLCTIGLNSRSGFSTVDHGFLPFDYCPQPLDIVRLEKVVEREPSLSYVPMSAPQAQEQIVSGIDKLEDQRYRWMGRRGVLLLKSPGIETPLLVDLYIPDTAPGREITVTLDGALLVRQRYDKPGPYKLQTKPIRPAGQSASLTIEIDKTYSVHGDQRILGLILVGAGFQGATP